MIHHNPKLFFSCCFIFIFLAFYMEVAATAEPKANDLAIFDIANDEAFAGYRKPLTSFLISRHVHRKTDVCILGETESTSKWAWVIWPGGNTMILWGGGKSSMSGSRRILHLARDVVATDDDVAGSTYRVTKAWVASQKKRCLEYGTQVSIAASDLTKRSDTKRTKP